MNPTALNVRPQTYAEYPKAFLGVRLDETYKYLIVNDREGDFYLNSVTENYFDDVQEQNVFQGRQLFLVQTKLRDSNYRIKPLNTFKVISVEKVLESTSGSLTDILAYHIASNYSKENNYLERVSDIINSIFWENVKPLIKGDEQFYRNQFANFIEWHMANYFICRPILKQEIPPEPTKFRTSSPRGRPPKLTLLQIPGNDNSQSLSPRQEAIKILGKEPRKTSSSPKPLKISPRQEYAIKNLGKEGIELCYHCWMHHLLKWPDDPLWKDRITFGDFERIEKNNLLKTPLMNFLIQEQLARMIAPILNKHSLSGDIGRNIFIISWNEHHLSTGSSYKRKMNRFERLLRFLLNRLDASKEVADEILKKLNIFSKQEKKESKPEFDSICEKFISKLGADQYENKLFMFLAVLSQQTYVFPILSMKAIIPGIPLEYQQTSRKLNYKFTPCGKNEFHASILVNLSKDPSNFPSKEFSCPYFEIEVINLMRLTDQGVWQSELEYRLRLDKDVDRKQIDTLVFLPLIKMGLNVLISWEVSTSNLIAK